MSNGGNVKRVLGVVGVGLGVLLAAVMALTIALVGPWVRDDVVLDSVVQAVALDWRDFGRDAAIARLQYELDHRQIGLQVEDDDCALDEGPEGREVRCRWGVALAVPGTDAHVPLRFDSRALITPEGDLR